MAVYTGQVSTKNGLGRVKDVTATDDMSFALAFGVSGNLGQVYSNKKIGMLRLEGETKHQEVAVDPAEMMRVESLEYARSHANGIVNFGALANSLMQTNATEMVSKTRAISSAANVNELTDETRGEIAKLLIGVGNEEAARKAIESDDGKVALIDTVKRNAVRATYQQTSMVGGVEFTISARGTTAVVVQENTKLIAVRVVMDGHVPGSASAAGSKYKKDFIEIKKAVTSVAESEELDRKMRYDPAEDVEATANNIYSLLTQYTRQVVRQAVTRIENQFSELDTFNPASTKAKLWSELNLTTSEVSQTKLDEKALREYAENKITAIQFASMPENGMIEKLKAAILKRLDHADRVAFSERILDRVAPNQKDRADRLKEIEKEVDKAIEKIKSDVEATKSFEEVYELYARPNHQWETYIIERVAAGVNNEDLDVDDKVALTKRVYEIVYPLALNESNDQYDAFRRRYEIDKGSPLDQVEIPELVADKYTDMTSETAIEEIDGLSNVNIQEKLLEYIKPGISVMISSLVVGSYDFTSASETAKEMLVELLTNTDPYSKLDDIYWRSVVSDVKRLKELTHFAKSEHVAEFVEKYAPDWTENLKDDQFSRKQQIEEMLRAGIDAAAHEVYTQKMTDENMPSDIIAKYSKVVDQLASSQAALAIDEFIESSEDLSENNLSDTVKDYVKQNFDEAFLDSSLERVLDYDAIVEELSDRLLDMLGESSEFNVIDRNYWLFKVNEIQHRAELGEYVKNSNLAGFTERYAPDWQEIKKENEDRI